MGNHRCKVSKLIPEDILGNGRTCFRLPSHKDARLKLSVLPRKQFENCISLDEYLEKLDGLNVGLVEGRKRFPLRDDFYDCRDWVFDNAGLHEYSKKRGWTADILVDEDLPGVSWIGYPEKNAIVMYLGRDRSPAHWGIVSEVRGEVRVDSKWGLLDVYNHPLNCVPNSYEDYVMFFEKK